jgi:hypothetical protein
MDLSGVAMISFITMVDAFKRSAALSPASNIPADNTPAPIHKNPSLFIFINLSFVTEFNPLIP